MSSEIPWVEFGESDRVVCRPKLLESRESGCNVTPSCLWLISYSTWYFYDKIEWLFITKRLIVYSL